MLQPSIMELIFWTKFFQGHQTHVKVSEWKANSTFFKLVQSNSRESLEYFPDFRIELLQFLPYLVFYDVVKITNISYIFIWNLRILEGYLFCSTYAEL